MSVLDVRSGTRLSHRSMEEIVPVDDLMKKSNYTHRLEPSALLEGLRELAGIVLSSCESLTYRSLKGRCLMRRIGGAVLTVTGFLACPCHLIVTLPLLASLLAGTALGSFLSRNTGLVYTGAGIYFVVALTLGAWFLFGPKRGKREMDAACPTCAPVASETRVQEQPSMPEDLPATRREALR